MRSRLMRILLLGVFSLWFGVIVPGHERGAIRVPGAGIPASALTTAAEQSCHGERSCRSCPGESDPAPASDDSDPAGHCAICHLTGVLDAPAAVHFTLPQAQLLACLPPASYQSIASVAVLAIDRGRDPPALFI